MLAHPRGAWILRGERRLPPFPDFSEVRILKGLLSRFSEVLILNGLRGDNFG
jgi:hypothetical protein